MEHMYWLNGARTHPPFPSENLFVPTTTFPRLDHSTPQLQNGHFSSSFSSSSLLLLFWGKGRGRPKTAGPVRPMRGQYRLPGSSHWVSGRGQAASPSTASSRQPPPIRRPFTQKVPTKTQPALGNHSLPQNAGISCFLQILRSRAKFQIFSIIGNNLHQFRGSRRLEDLSVNIRMQTCKNRPHLHLASPPVGK